MKTLIYPSLMVLLGVILSCCTPEKNKQTEGLTAEQTSSITKEIIQVTDNWGNAAKAHDIPGSKLIWSNSGDFRFAENGELFLGYNSLSDYMDKAYSAIESIKFSWTNREVFPLTPNIACFAATYDFTLTFKDGSNQTATNAFTATFLKSDSGWKVINGHESTKPKQ